MNEFKGQYTRIEGTNADGTPNGIVFHSANYDWNKDIAPSVITAEGILKKHLAGYENILGNLNSSAVNAMEEYADLKVAEALSKQVPPEPC